MIAVYNRVLKRAYFNSFRHKRDGQRLSTERPKSEFKGWGKRLPAPSEGLAPSPSSSNGTAS